MPLRTPSHSKTSAYLEFERIDSRSEFPLGNLNVTAVSGLSQGNSQIPSGNYSRSQIFDDRSYDDIRTGNVSRNEDSMTRNIPRNDDSFIRNVTRNNESTTRNVPRNDDSLTRNVLRNDDSPKRNILKNEEPSMRSSHQNIPQNDPRNVPPNDWQRSSASASAMRALQEEDERSRDRLRSYPDMGECYADNDGDNKMYKEVGREREAGGGVGMYVRTYAGDSRGGGGGGGDERGGGGGDERGGGDGGGEEEEDDEPLVVGQYDESPDMDYDQEEDEEEEEGEYEGDEGTVVEGNREQGEGGGVWEDGEDGEDSGNYVQVLGNRREGEEENEGEDDREVTHQREGGIGREKERNDFQNRQYEQDHELGSESEELVDFNFVGGEERWHDDRDDGDFEHSNSSP